MLIYRKTRNITYICIIYMYVYIYIYDRSKMVLLHGCEM